MNRKIFTLNFICRLSELERRPSSTSTDHSIRHGHSFRHHHDTRNNSLGYDHPPRRHDHYNSLGHDHPRRQDHFNSRRYDHSSRYDYSSRTLTSLDTPTRQYASLDNESYSYSGFYAGGVSLPRFKPSRFSYKSPNHYYPYGDYSLPPDLSNGHRQHRRRREHADRIECVRVKAGEIRKDRARPSSVRSASIRHSKSSDDNNSIQIDLKSLCDTSLSSRLGGSGSGGGTAGLFPPSVTNSSEGISRLPSQSFSEPCTPFYETPERRNGPPPARGKNGTANPPLQTPANSKNLNVAFSKNDSKVWLSVDSPETGPLKSAAAAAKKTAIVTNKTRTCRTKGETVLKSKTKKSDNDRDTWIS